MPGLIVDKVGGSDHYAEPVADLAELAAIPLNKITDKQRRFVDRENTDYFFDVEANTGDLAPNGQQGVGFWIREKDGVKSLQEIHDSQEGVNNYENELYVENGGDYFMMGINEANDSYFDFWGGEAYVDFFGNGGGLSLGLYQSSPAFSWYGYGTSTNEDTMIDARSGQVELQATSYNFYNDKLVSGSVSLEEGRVEILTYIQDVGNETFYLRTPPLSEIAGKEACNVEFPYKPGNYKVPLIPANETDILLEKPKRLKNQSLAAVNWVQNNQTNLWEYTFENAHIKTTTEVEIIPQNTAIQTVINAGVQPYTLTKANKVTIYAENKPAQDFTVNIIITQVKDV